eukprot:jgi/Bigna1/72806/fgenesh1_pg.21_\
MGGLRCLDGLCLLACVAGILLAIQNEGSVSFVHVWVFPSSSERVDPLIRDLDGDGGPEIIVATREPKLRILQVSIIGSGDEAETKDLKSVESKDAAAESLAAHKERITRGHLDTVSKVDPNWAQVRVISEVSMSGKLKVKTGRYPVAVGTGYVDGYSEETNRKQIIVVVTDGCKVLCYTSELQLMWEQNLHCDLLENYVSEVSIFVTSHSIMKGDRGMDDGGHYSLYCFEGNTGQERWTHVAGDFEPELDPAEDLSPIPQVHNIAQRETCSIHAFIPFL